MVEGAVVALAVVLAFFPRRRGTVEVAALCGALIIALQLAANYWLYSYVVWFAPAVLVGLFASFPAAERAPAEASEEPSVTWTPAPIPAGSPTPASAQ
jgi:hypothetical protein